VTFTDRVDGPLIKARRKSTVRSQENVINHRRRRRRRRRWRSNCPHAPYKRFDGDLSS